MARPRSATRPEKHAERQAEPATTRPIPTLPLVIFAAVVIVFTWLFYTDVPDRTRGARISALAFLAGPDHLLAMWCGGRLADFSLLDRWPIVLLAAVILGGAWLAGRLLLAALGVNPLLDRLEQFAFAMGAGLNLLSLYALAVGLAGMLQRRWMFVVPLVMLAAANAAMMFRRKGTPPSAGMPHREFPTECTGTNDPRWYWLLAAAAPFALVIVLGGMIPPFDYDVREYHLQAPKEWFQIGRVSFLPHNIYANMPLGAELNSVWAMSLVGGTDGWWWGALAGKTVMACYSLITAAALVAVGRRVHSLAAGCIAAAVFLSTPWTVVLAITGYNEAGVMLYAILAIFALWLAARFQLGGDALRFYLLGGFLAGSAVACKYPPALFLVIPLAIWTLAATWGPQRDWRRTAAALMLFVAGSAAGGSCWLAKNWVQTGNPVYPLLYSAFDGTTRTPEKDRQWTRAHSPQPDGQGRRFAPSNLADNLAWVGWRMMYASSILVPLMAMAVLDRERWRLSGCLALWMLFVFASWWLVTHRLDRFLLLLLPVASLLAALGALAIEHVAWRVAALALIGWGLASQLCFVGLPLGDNRFFAPLAELRRDEPRLTQAVGERLNPAQRWLNEHAQPGEWVLLVGDAEPFELRIGAVYNTCFDDCQFARLFQGKSRAERLAALRDERIRYVVFHWSHLNRYRSPANYGYTSDYVTPELVHGELVAEQGLLRPIAIDADPNKVELYEVADP